MGRPRSSGTWTPRRCPSIVKAVEVWLPVLSAVLMVGGHSVWRAVSVTPAPVTPVVIQFELPIPRVTVEHAPMVSDYCGPVRPFPLEEWERDVRALARIAYPPRGGGAGRPRADREAVLAPEGAARREPPLSPSRTERFRGRNCGYFGCWPDPGGIRYIRDESETLLAMLPESLPAARTANRQTCTPAECL